MTDGLAGLNLIRRYSTNRNELVGEFYDPCLSRSVTYDRAVGYFRSSILLLVMRPIATFAQSGGRMRLVCSPEMTAEDVDALGRGYDWRQRVDNSLLQAIATAMDDAVGKGAIHLLATLVAVGCLDLRVAFRPGAIGIFHDKLGVFRDSAGDAVSFTGSSNETFAAWNNKGNHESFDVFRSWDADGDRVNEHGAYFDRLWMGTEPGVETIHFPEVARERLIEVASDRGVGEAYGIAERIMNHTSSVLRPHQKEALDAWDANSRRGIFEHATGSGKTITALEAIRQWLKEGRPALVIVPSDLLLDQWAKEASRAINDPSLMLLIAGGGHDSWTRDDIIEGFTGADGGPRLTIAMLQTASNADFVSRVKGGEHLLVVIDEVHRAGSNAFSRVLEIEAGARLGLSATPQRYGDPIGTHKLISYFHGIVHRFTLQAAMNAGWLCRYMYFVHPAELSDEESKEYQDLTERIGREIARSAGSAALSTGVLSGHAKMLLIRRARVVKKAASKVPLAARIIKEEFRSGDRWLVYCEDQEQLNALLHSLIAAGLPANEYHFAMSGDRRQTLAHLTVAGGIVVAIRCLDEGVDIPEVDHALILASSRNPREFIQRRGRLLRLAPGKYMSTVHDLLVLPAPGSSRGLSVGELSRAWEFAQSAENSSVRLRLRHIGDDLGIDISDVLDLATNSEEDVS